MRPGPLIRRVFGPYERNVAEVYRRLFVDLNDLVAIIVEWVPQPKNILEVGCGEGAITERIARSYPTASITAIDITPKVGRLYRGPSASVKFREERVEEIARRRPGSFDLVVLADVMHHVPENARRKMMAAIDQLLTAGGSFVFKDWVVSNRPIHWFCTCSDRYLTGDKVAYFYSNGMEALLANIFPGETILQKRTVRPWRNNVAILVRR